MRIPIVFVSLSLLAAAPVLAQDSAVAPAAQPAAVAPVPPPPPPPEAPAAPAAAAAPAAPAAPKPAMTVARVDRHVTRTVTALMQRLAQSRIAPETRSQLNERLLAIQDESAAAARSGQPPSGEDLEKFSARLGKSLDSVAGSIDSASERAERLVSARTATGAAARP